MIKNLLQVLLYSKYHHMPTSEYIRKTLRHKLIAIYFFCRCRLLKGFTEKKPCPFLCRVLTCSLGGLIWKRAEQGKQKNQVTVLDVDTPKSARNRSLGIVSIQPKPASWFKSVFQRRKKQNHAWGTQVQEKMKA